VYVKIKYNNDGFVLSDYLYNINGYYETDSLPYILSIFKSGPLAYSPLIERFDDIKVNDILILYGENDWMGMIVNLIYR
jgi:hypothetical protein